MLCLGVSKFNRLLGTVLTLPFLLGHRFFTKNGTVTVVYVVLIRYTKLLFHPVLLHAHMENDPNTPVSDLTGHIVDTALSDKSKSGD